MFGFHRKKAEKAPSSLRHIAFIMDGNGRWASKKGMPREYGHSAKRELSYLVVHSVLHLLGYDHLDEGPQKAQMREREEAIMEELGILR